MNKFDTIIFDLDGTLVDTSRDITRAVNYARAHYGLSPLSTSEVIKFVGSGVTRLLEKSLITPENKIDLDEARIFTINYYKDHLIDESVIYPGIIPLLQGLSNDCNLAVASNKPLALTKSAIKGLNLHGFFKVIAGPETTGKDKPEPDMLISIAKELGTFPEKILMVGDSPVDIEAARKFGCKGCAVTWGYNLSDILHSLKPDFLIHEPLDLLEIISTFAHPELVEG